MNKQVLKVVFTKRNEELLQKMEKAGLVRFKTAHNKIHIFVGSRIKYGKFVKNLDAFHQTLINGELLTQKSSEDLFLEFSPIYNELKKIVIIKDVKVSETAKTLLRDLCNTGIIFFAFERGRIYFSADNLKRFETMQQILQTKNQDVINVWIRYIELSSIDREHVDTELCALA